MAKGIRKQLLSNSLIPTLVIMVLLTSAVVLYGLSYMMAVAQETLLEDSQLRAQIVSYRIQQEVSKLEYLAATGTAKALNGAEILSLLKGMVSDADNRLLVNALYATPDGTISSLFNETGSIANQPYFIKLRRNNLDSTVSDPIATLPEQPPIVVILASIRDPYGNISGVLGSAIDLGKLSDTLSDVNSRDTVYSWIVDEKGAVIAFPSTEALERIGFKEPGKPQFAGGETIGQDKLKAASGTFSFTDPLDGQDKTAVFTTIPGTAGWKLCTAIAKSVVNYPIYLAAGLLIFGTVLLVASLFLNGKRIARSLITPIAQVAFSAENLERGTLHPVDEPASPEEIYHLVRTFNRMANAMNVHAETLAKAVEEKEKTLKNITGRISERNDRMSQTSEAFLDIATRDQITHLLTRSEMVKQLEQIKTEVDDGVAESFSLLLMGLDNFEQCVKTYGSEAGDLIVQKTARMVSGAIRSTDLAARYGNETFMILLTGTNQARADIVIKKLTQSFDEHHGFEDDLFGRFGARSQAALSGPRLTLTVSSVMYTKSSGQTKETLIRQAESAMVELRRERRRLSTESALGTPM